MTPGLEPVVSELALESRRHGFFQGIGVAGRLIYDAALVCPDIDERNRLFELATTIFGLRP